MKKSAYGLLGLLSMGTLFLLWCGGADKVQLGDTVTIEYTSTFSNGTAFQTSWTTFVVGSGQIIAGLENGIIGMKVGDTQEISVLPAEGYGSLYNTFNLQKISKLIFDKMSASSSGTISNIGGVPWVIKWTEKDANGNELVLFDINPRETWDSLTYKVTLVSKTSK